MLDRAEHLQWCKDRAVEYLEADQLPQAFSSLVVDLGKHPETRTLNVRRMTEGMELAMHGDKEGLRDWINDFV